MKPIKTRIGIAKIDEVPDSVTEAIAAYISDYLHLSTVILPSIEPPADAFDPVRGQYDAGVIITRLESLQFQNITKVVYVFSEDLFVPVFTHVFGEARQGGKVAIVSLFRLREKTTQINEPSPNLLERAAKVALHELSHLFNLYHCERKDCLMHFSGLIDDLDQTPAKFCDYCLKYFQAAVSRSKL